MRLEAAEVFAGHGLTATLADVAKAAGVGVRHPLPALPGQDELILAIYRARMDAAVALAERSSTAADPGTVFREFIEHGAHDFATDRGFSRAGARWADRRAGLVPFGRRHRSPRPPTCH